MALVLLPRAPGSDNLIVTVFSLLGCHRWLFGGSVNGTASDELLRIDTEESILEQHTAYGSIEPRFNCAVMVVRNLALFYGGTTFQKQKLADLFILDTRKPVFCAQATHSWFHKP